MNSKFKYRVLEDRGASFVVQNEEGFILSAELSGRMKQLDPLSWPTTGDGVDGELQPGGWLYIDHSPTDQIYFCAKTERRRKS